MAVFDEMYKRNLWGFGSGHGSLPRVTKSYRNLLENFIKENNIQTIVDLGCGDWQFSQQIDWSEASYLGLDIVDSLIRKNNTKFGGKNVRFEAAPKSFKQLPKADLLIVKDVLQHWPNKDVRDFLDAIKTRYKFVLTTNCIESELPVNEDIEMGGFRGLDIRIAPFNTPATVLHSFTGPKTYSFKERTSFPAWRKLVMLIDQQ